MSVVQQLFLVAGLWDLLPTVNSEFEAEEFLDGAQQGFLAFQRAFHNRDIEFLREITTDRVFTALKSTVEDLDAAGITVLADKNTGGYTILDAYIDKIVLPGVWDDTSAEFWVKINVRYNVEQNIIMKDKHGETINHGDSRNRVGVQFEGCLRGAKELEWRISDLP